MKNVEYLYARIVLLEQMVIRFSQIVTNMAMDEDQEALEAMRYDHARSVNALLKECNPWKDNG